MTKDEMIELAKQAGWQYAHGESGYEALWAFGKLVAEKEREACAELCDDRTTAYQYATDSWAQEHINEAKHLAETIRARGQE